MDWFPYEIKSAPDWRIQFMGVVAWLGASAIDMHANAMATSPFRYLPRVIPGPWDLSKTGLSRTLYKTNSTLRATACQARSEFPFIGRLPDQLHMIMPEMKESRHFVPLSIHRWSIRFNCERIGLQPEQKPQSCMNGKPCSVFAFTQRLSEFAHSISPTDFLTILSFPITIGLASFCATRKDGSAVLGLSFISIHTILSSRAIRVKVRDHLSPELETTFELVVRTPENAFWIIECDSLAYNALVKGVILLPIRGRQNNSELFRDPGQPRHPRQPKRTPLINPLLLIFLILSLFMFCNATFISQLSITSAYIFLTALYILIMPLGVCPGELNITTKFDSLSPTSHLRKPEERQTERNPTIARTVWYVIKLTRSTTWVRSVDAIPDSPGWNRWLEEACKNINCPDWPAEGEKKRLVDNNKSIYNLQELPEGGTHQEPISVIPVHESKW